MSDALLDVGLVDLVVTLTLGGVAVYLSLWNHLHRRRTRRALMRRTRRRGWRPGLTLSLAWLVLAAVVVAILAGRALVSVAPNPRPPASATVWSTP